VSRHFAVRWNDKMASFRPMKIKEDIFLGIFAIREMMIKLNSYAIVIHNLTDKPFAEISG
jgi:hypothetical protein